MVKKCTVHIHEFPAVASATFVQKTERPPETEKTEVMSMAHRCAPWTYQHYAQNMLIKILRIC
jgi:hypothetical protein